MPCVCFCPPRCQGHGQQAVHARQRPHRTVPGDRRHSHRVQAGRPQQGPAPAPRGLRREHVPAGKGKARAHPPSQDRARVGLRSSLTSPVCLPSSSWERGFLLCSGKAPFPIETCRCQSYGPHRSHLRGRRGAGNRLGRAQCQSGGLIHLSFP